MKQHTHNAMMEVVKAKKKNIPSTIPTISATVRSSAMRE